MINKEIFEFPIVYTNPIPRIALGWGAYQTTGDECKAAGMKKALIVTSGLKGTGIIDEMKGVINHAGVSVDVFDKITSNPKNHEVMAAYQAFKDAKCDGVVAVGGGSSIDAAKCIRVVDANGGKDVTNFSVFLNPPFSETLRKMKPCTIPQISVATTSGTGAEVSSWAALNNTKARAKVLVSGPNVHSTLAIVDPLLVRLQSREMAAWSGFDAMAHGIEAFVTKVQGPYASGMLLQAVELISKNLREFVYNRMDNHACERMCWAATLGGIAIGFGAGAGIVHGLGHQVSALKDVHHGRINAVMMLAGERYNQPAITGKLAALVRAMGVDTSSMTTWQAAERWFIEIEQMLKDLDIQPGHISDQFGIEEKDLEHIVNVYRNDFCSQGNPREFNHDEVITLLKRVMHNSY
jgi:methanol:N,N-dimethyl-4-nitrosoaniline oxidoreductase